MNNESIREFQVQARRGELIENYRDRGLFRPGGEEMRVMAPIEDLISSIRRYVLDGKPDDSVTIEAAFGLVNDRASSSHSKYYSDFVSGLRYGLGEVGVMSRIKIKEPVPGEHVGARNLGIKLPQLLKDEHATKELLTTYLEGAEIERQKGEYRLALYAVKFALKDLVERYDLPMFDRYPSEKDIQAAEQFFGLDDKFVVKGKTVKKDWLVIERNLIVLDQVFHVRGMPLDLTSKSGIATHLLMSLSQLDWDNRVNEIKKANGGYPSYWNDLIFGYSAGAMGLLFSADKNVPNITNITRMRWDILSGKEERPIRLRIGESLQTNPHRYEVQESHLPLAKTLDDVSHRNILAQDIIYFVTGRDLVLSDVAHNFIEDYCPWFLDSMRVPEGELEAEQLRNLFAKLAVNGEVSVSAVAVLLYEALDMTPARARLILPRFFTKELKGEDGAFIMQKVEEKLDLPHGTFSEVFDNKEYPYKLVPQTHLEDEPLLQVMDVVADTYRDGVRFGVKPEELDDHVEQMLRENPVLTEYFQDKDAHFIVNNFIRLVVGIDREHEMEHFFGK